MEYTHTPVLLKEVIDYLNIQPGGIYVDGTLGGAGYTIEIAKRIGKDGLVYGFDLDPSAIQNAEKIIVETGLKNIRLVNDNYRNFTNYLNEDEKKQEAPPSVAGIVLDLGLSSAQLEDKGRGFSFLVDAPLDMAFGVLPRSTYHTTHSIVNSYKQSELEKIIKEYGEERYAKLIVRKIVEYRKNKKIDRTSELVEIIMSAVPNSYRHDKKIHFATKTFQALRIATNDELSSLRDALADALEALRPGGRIVVVSFHSLEDRIVKQFFRTESKDCLCPPERPVCKCGHQAQLKIITKKAITASEAEIERNPRARSAKLRVAEKI